MKLVKLSAALVFVLPLALFAFAAAPAAAADANPHAAFLQSLAQTVEEPQEDPLPGVGVPDPTPQACTVSRPCGDGNTVSCTGTSSCVYSQKGVKCDGVESACPNFCSMGWTCQDCPAYTFVCWSLSGDCGVTNSGCNGQPQRCFCPFEPQF
jgi:hypothetical protein